MNHRGNGVLLTRTAYPLSVPFCVLLSDSRGIQHCGYVDGKGETRLTGNAVLQKSVQGCICSIAFSDYSALSFLSRHKEGGVC